MPYKPCWTPRAETRFRELEEAAVDSMARRQSGGASKSSKSSKAEGLFKQVEKCLRLLLDNPRHPGLNTHEFTSIESPFDPAAKVFEAYVQNRTPGAYRLFWCYGPGKGEITIITITQHP